ncbi:MAG: hypothetical protein NTZ05_10155, partial [Chloroflexi bacterium]|nr:hypothetical protein [Chloroflexota bacterium]
YRHAEEAISLAEATERRLERGLARAVLAEVVRTLAGAKDSESTVLFGRAMDDLEAAGARLAAERTAALWRDPTRMPLPPRR